MDQEKLWAVFEKTGKVQDYLRYCGIDVYGAGENAVSRGDTQEEEHEADDRRSDHTGNEYRR